jgi:L-glutamine-phosphate cytidylyltransferase
MKTTAVILAAGPGTRLTPHTIDLPKCLVKIGKNPILYYQLKALEKSAIKNILIVIGYKKEMIKNYTKKYFANLNFKFVYNPIFNRTNTLYSFALAAENINKKETVIQLNGDVFFDPAIISLLLKDKGQKSYSCVQFKKSCLEEVKFTLAKNGFINQLNKKIPLTKALGESIGINKFSPNFWKYLSSNLHKLKKKYALEYFEYAVEQTILQRKKIYPFDIKKMKAVEIDFPKDLKKANKISGF